MLKVNGDEFRFKKSRPLCSLTSPTEVPLKPSAEEQHLYKELLNKR